MKKYFIDSIMIFLLMVCVGIFFRQTILNQKLPVPTDTLVGMYHPWLDAIAKEYPSGIPFKNFLITDPVRQQIPWRKLAIESIKNHNFKPWNPYAFSGTPLLANIQAGFFYPFNVLFFFLSFPIAWTILIILQPILSGIFFYLFLKISMKLSPLSALFGTICFSFCGFSIVWLTWGIIGHTALWLPLIFLLFDLLCWSRERKKTVLISTALGFVLTIQYFAGHSQIFLYSSVLFVAYAIFQLSFGKQEIISKKRVAISVFGSLFLFVFLTSVHWIPFLSNLYAASRVLFGSMFQEEGFFLPFQNLVQFIAPDFFGNPATLNYWGVWNYAEFSGYIGVTGLIFAFYSLFSKRKTMKIFWLVILAFALLFALPNPISKIPYTLHIPVLSSLQPTRLIAIADIALCVLAAIGFEVWLQTNHKKQSAAVILIMVVLFGLLWYVVKGNPYGIAQENIAVTARNIIFPTGIFIAVLVLLSARIGLEAGIKHKGRMIAYISGVIIIGISFFDLSRFGWKFTPFTDRRLFFPKTEIVSFLENQPKPFRITAVDDRIMPPNVSSYYGIESIAGYDPLYDSRYETFIAAMERGEPNITPPFGFKRIITPKNISSPLFQLLGVRYILSLSDVSDPNFQKVFQEGQTRLYENTRALPRAYLVEKIMYEKDEKKIFEKLYDPTFAFGKDAIVEEQIQLTSQQIFENGNVEILAYDDNGMDLSVQTDINRLLCFGNLYHTGWKAVLDDREIPIYRVNYLFMGVVVPEGNHIVRFIYE